MTDNERSLGALEGRILAHRRLIARLLAACPDQEWTGHLEWLSERNVLQDGQEDPGAIPAEGLDVELSVSDEYNRLAELAASYRRNGDSR